MLDPAPFKDRCRVDKLLIGVYSGNEIKISTKGGLTNEELEKERILYT